MEKIDVTWVEVTKKEIDNAMLLPGEYVEKDGKFYVKPGMLDGHVDPKLCDSSKVRIWNKEMWEAWNY
jgi:hypothetical protein